MKISNKIFRLLPIVLLMIYSCNAQPQKKINWMSFEEAVIQNNKEPKKIFVDVYTHWCGWCKRMDASTFQNDSVAAYLNKHYYAVKLDAETKDTIFFKDKAFTFRAEHKANELALSLLNGKMGYPAFVFLDDGFNMLTTLSGYQNTDQLMPVLTYFGENIYRHKKWEEYVESKAGSENLMQPK